MNPCTTNDATALAKMEKSEDQACTAEFRACNFDATDRYKIVLMTFTIGGNSIAAAPLDN